MFLPFFLNTKQYYENSSLLMHSLTNLHFSVKIKYFNPFLITALIDKNKHAQEIEHKIKILFLLFFYLFYNISIFL